MNKYVKKLLLIIIIICVIVLLKLIVKMLLNDSFIRNYPDKEQEYRLKINTLVNIYEPYIVYYNYGNYLYQKEKYDEAYEKYIKALEYNIPNDNVCKINYNLGLTLVKKSLVDDYEKGNLLKEAQKYLQECIDIEEISNNSISLSLVLFIIIVIMCIIMLILAIEIKKHGNLLPPLNIEYIQKLETLLKNVINEDMEIKDAYYQMSVLIREFIEKKTKINVLNLTKNEIDKIGIKDLKELMEEYYPAQFSKGGSLDFKKSIERTMEVIRTWNWK